MLILAVGYIIDIICTALFNNVVYLSKAHRILYISIFAVPIATYLFLVWVTCHRQHWRALNYEISLNGLHIIIAATLLLLPLKIIAGYILNDPKYAYYWYAFQIYYFIWIALAVGIRNKMRDGITFISKHIIYMPLFTVAASIVLRVGIWLCTEAYGPIPEISEYYLIFYNNYVCYIYFFMYLIATAGLASPKENDRFISLCSGIILLLQGMFNYLGWAIWLAIFYDRLFFVLGPVTLGMFFIEVVIAFVRVCAQHKTKKAT